MAKQKVFGVGLHRTGTTSLRAAMPKLGYDTVPPWRWQGRHGNTLKRGDLLKDVFNLASSYDACIYMPFITFYKELYEAYPDAKFILTERDEGKWLKSMHSFFGGNDWPEVRFVFGADAKEENAEALKKVFRSHNQQVKDFFADKKGRLLIMDLSKGHGYTELCEFLGEELPKGETVFPRVNEQNSVYASIVKNTIPTVSYARRLMFGS